MDEFAGVLLNMDTGDAYLLAAAQGDISAIAERFIILGNLVGLGKIGIDIV